MSRFILPRQRAYVRAHPLAFSFSVGIALTGALSLLGLTQQQSNDLVLPQWLQTSFQITWTVGGAASVWGIARAEARFEAAGQALVSTGLIVLLATTLHLSQDRLHDLAGLAFVVALAIGSALRSLHLMKGGGYFDPGIISANLTHEEMRDLLREEETR